MGRKTRSLPVVVAIAITTVWLLALPGCRGCAEPSEAEVVVYTSVDQVFSSPVFKRCEAKTGLTIRAGYDTEETKSTGLVNRLIAEAAQPQADVFWSNEPVRPFLLAKRGLVEVYRPEKAARVPAAFRGEDGSWTGLAARARVLLVNTDAVPEGAQPGSILDLTDPRWRGKTAIANPLFGTTTVHMAALFRAWGDERARAFLKALRDNDVRVASSNGEVRRLVVSGEVAFGLTDTDDAQEALESGAHVRIVYPDQGQAQDSLGTLVMPTVVVLIKGGPHPKSARRLIDCLVSPEVERSLAQNGAHMPLMSGVPTPDGVRPVSEIRAMKVDYRALADEMERIQPLLREWVGL